ncbi:MAG: DUF2298 domain-containing protein [Anaerolineaceae bacterium]
MIDIFRWYVALSVIGLINLPLSFVLFSKLPTRGFALARPVGLLLWAFPYWLLVSLGLLRNDLTGQLTVLIALAVINGFVYFKHSAELKIWFAEHKPLMVRAEVLFLITFLVWSLVRSLNPDIVNTEKFMEMAFINGILRSPSFPPLDPWLSGFGISYYYFGYVMSAMLIRLSGVISSIGYNLISSSWFAMTALAVYGLLIDLIANWKAQGHSKNLIKPWMLNAALIAPLMLLVVSNWHGVFDVMHERGLLSQQTASGEVQSEFWTKLDLRDLEIAPTTSNWIPERTWQWWAASRTVKDFRLQGEGLEVIDEFPFFTYLLSDIHPHLLGMPFVLMAISQALNALSGGWEGETNLLGLKVPIKGNLLWFIPILLGGIAFMNTWDFPFYLLLVCVAFVYRRYLQLGMRGRTLELILLGVGFGVSSIVFYLPFYLGFSSQAGGILPSLVFFTRGKYFWIMFGPLLIPMISFMLVKVIKARKCINFGLAAMATLGINLALFVGSWGLGWLINTRLDQPQMVEQLYGQTENASVFLQAILVRLKDPWTWLTLAALTFLALSLVLRRSNLQSEEQPANSTNTTYVFVGLLVLLGGLMTLLPEFVFLRDQFVSRMNSIFKFYFQAWVVWSIAASFGLIYLLNPEKPRRFYDQMMPWLLVIVGIIGVIIAKPGLTNGGTMSGDIVVVVILALFSIWLLSNIIRKQWRYALAVISLIALAGGLVYPAVALPSKIGSVDPERITLDGFKSIGDGNLDQANAIEWLKQAPTGVMAEAVAKSGGSYTTYNIISAFTGMPSVLGWIGHEAQWRGGYEEIGSRQADLETLYSTNDWQRAKEVIERYDIRYIYVGELERSTYNVEEIKFVEYTKLIFESNNVRIFEVTNP